MSKDVAGALGAVVVHVAGLLLGSALGIVVGYFIHRKPPPEFRIVYCDPTNQSCPGPDAGLSDDLRRILERKKAK